MRMVISHGFARLKSSLAGIFTGCFRYIRSMMMKRMRMMRWTDVQ